VCVCFFILAVLFHRPFHLCNSTTLSWQSTSSPPSFSFSFLATLRHLCFHTHFRISLLCP
jgi:hypothetical protein